MRKIFIDKALKQKVKNFYEHLFENRPENFIPPLERLETLKKSYGIPKGKGEEYIELLENNFDKIIIASPSKLKKWKMRFERIIPSEKITEEFSNAIVKALCYKELRTKDYLRFALENGIKTCVYCNSQLTLNIPTKYRKRKFLSEPKGAIMEYYGNYELDHIYPKRQFPFLAISFFNLVPCCAPCNKSKSNLSFNYYPFSEIDSDLNNFRFKLSKKSVHQYWKDKTAESLEIEIELLSIPKDQFDEYNNIFKISFLYDSQKDIAEELIHKKELYSNAYKKNLVTSFEKLFPDKSMITRLILGNYPKQEDIFKRPMAKFTQDIAHDIGLIKIKEYSL